MQNADPSTDDRQWFARHVGRSHRLRLPFAVETKRLRDPIRPGCRVVAIVRQVRPGARQRRLAQVVGEVATLNTEAFASALFELAVEGNRRRCVAQRSDWTVALCPC